MWLPQRGVDGGAEAVSEGRVLDDTDGVSAEDGPHLVRLVTPDDEEADGSVGHLHRELDRGGAERLVARVVDVGCWPG